MSEARAKHTPEPWVALPFDWDKNRAIIETVERGKEIPEQGYVVGTAVGSEANAALIAAAPELLEALEEVLRYHWNAESKCMQKAKEIINRAKGELT